MASGVIRNNHYLDVTPSSDSYDSNLIDVLCIRSSNIYTASLKIKAGALSRGSNTFSFPTNVNYVNNPCVAFYSRDINDMDKVFTGRANNNNLYVRASASNTESVEVAIIGVIT